MGEMQQIVLTQYCVGEPKPPDFRLETLPLPEPKDGQFRVRHVWCSVDPGTRSRLSGGDSYAAALPLGKPIDGFSVGVIDASTFAHTRALSDKAARYISAYHNFILKIGEGERFGRKSRDEVFKGVMGGQTKENPLEDKDDEDF